MRPRQSLPQPRPSRREVAKRLGIGFVLVVLIDVTIEMALTYGFHIKGDLPVYVAGALTGLVGVPLLTRYLSGPGSDRRRE